MNQLDIRSYLLLLEQIGLNRTVIRHAGGRVGAEQSLVVVGALLTPLFERVETRAARAAFPSLRALDSLRDKP